MAFTEERSITCPACGYERMEEVWMALDTITFPFKKWELLNRSMFRHKCLHCGHEFDMDHDFRYHQPESRELIWYVRSDEEEKEALDVLANGKRSGAWDEEERRMFDAVTDDYILRVVRSQKALIEKGYQLLFESPTNQVYLIVPDDKLPALGKAVVYSFWEKYDEARTVIRLSTSWASTQEEVERLISIL